MSGSRRFNTPLVFPTSSNYRGKTGDTPQGTTQNEPVFDRFSLESLSSPIITFKVGPDGAVLTAHKSVLIKADYFDKCLEEGHFAEGQSNIITCPEDDPEDMAALVRYLYTGLVQDPKETPTLARLIRNYAIADKYCAGDMSSNVLRAVIRADNIPLDWSHMEQLKAAGLHGSDIWSALIRRIGQGVCGTRKNDEIQQLWRDGLKSDEQTATEVMEWLIKQPATGHD